MGANPEEFAVSAGWLLSDHASVLSLVKGGAGRYQAQRFKKWTTQQPFPPLRRGGLGGVVRRYQAQRSNKAMSSERH